MSGISIRCSHKRTNYNSGARGKDHGLNHCLAPLFHFRSCLRWRKPRKRERFICCQLASQHARQTKQAACLPCNTLAPWALSAIPSGSGNVCARHSVSATPRSTACRCSLPGAGRPRQVGGIESRADVARMARTLLFQITPVLGRFLLTWGRLSRRPLCFPPMRGQLRSCCNRAVLPMLRQ